MIDYTQRLQKIEVILQKKLPSTYSKEWVYSSFGMCSEAITSNHFDSLSSACRDLLQLGGKRWRPLLLVLCAELAGCSKDDTTPYELTPAVEFIHTASLIHDDIEDSADLRRGKPAAHITYGIDTAINSASWLYFEAFSCIKELSVNADIQLRIHNLIGEQVRRLHLGQSMDIMWHKASTFPARQEYEAMIRLKTGTLACLAATLGLLCAGESDSKIEKMGKYASDIGAGFQILDDVINITTGNVGKKRGDDIVEGKKSLPVLLHIDKHPDDAHIISNYFESAQKKGIEALEVEQCITLLESSGVIAEAKTYASTLITNACTGIEQMYNKNDRTSLITKLFTNMLR